MFFHYRTQGIILKKVDRGEADQLFTIYTKDFGKLEILAKAIRKISSKLRPGAEIFCLSEIEFIQGKTHKTLTDAILIDKFANLRSDLKRLKVAYKISEAFDDLISDQESDEKIWHLLKATFNKLSNCQIVKLSDCQILYYYFLWNFLSLLGYQPELYNCSLCQRKLKPERFYFSPKEGGVICQNCHAFGQNVSNGVKSVQEISPEAVKILRIILKKDWRTILKLKIERVHWESLRQITKNYFLYIRNQFVIS